MTQKRNILQIAIQTPLRRTFDYLPPNGDNCANYTVGQRVEVSFGRRTVVGIIVGFSEKSNFPIDKLKAVNQLLDSNALVDEKLLQLFDWASRYYCYPIGEVILGSLPKKLRQLKQASTKKTDNHVEKEQAEKKARSEKLVLTIEQQEAVDAILKTKQFQSFLLAGVTGSGKTEVYLQVIESVLNERKQALVLVPEISLTPQTLARFESRLHAPVLLVHSGLSDGKRAKAWLKAASGEPCVVIGTRSAIFSPLNNLGVIVVDEAHDISFKQQSRFRYCARDVAVMRAKICDVPIVLGTATPSLESLYNVEDKKYHLLRLTDRPGHVVMPKVTLCDIRNQKLQGGLSTLLIEKIKDHLSQSHQVLVYLNRRGYAPVLICHHCGWTAACPRCDVKLTVHQSPKRLMCHHCGFQKPWQKICESCKQSEVMLLGLGTEQLEQTLSTLFPDKNIVRVDRDNVRTFNALKEVLSIVHEQKADILVGTQLLVKGHHFENVNLVAAIDVDNALFSSDFRAVERLGQSLVQVAGRAGRDKHSGEVIIQTHQPDHPSLKSLFNADYLTFANNLLQERKAMLLPPFQYSAALKAEAKTQELAMHFLNKAKINLKKNGFQLEILGPLPATLAKKAGVYRAHLLIQSGTRPHLHHALDTLLASLEQKKVNNVKWVVDVDPVESD